MSTVFLTHNKIQLALHQLRAGDGRPLLLLHGLGEQSPAARAGVGRRRGPARCTALDFTGHGASTVPMGGGYSAETCWPTPTSRSPTSGRPRSSAAGWARTWR